LLDDDTEPTASEFVDFTSYGEVIPAGLERPPRDVEEPRLWTLTDDTARALADKRTQAAYDEYLHIGCYAFFDRCANAVGSEGLDALSNGPPLSTKRTAAVALIRAGHRTRTATEEAARTRMGFLRLTKGGHASTNADRVFAEMAHERSCRPHPTAVSGPLDALRQAFVDRTLEVRLHVASKAAAGAAFANSPEKLRQLAQHASSMLGRAASNARWLPTRQLAAFAGKTQFLYLAIAPARFFLRELHNVLATPATSRPRVVVYNAQP
jgi:hypothetical protein